MCNENCCCKNASTSELINYLLIFTIINLGLSFAAIFLRAAKTKRYDDALMYLEARNNGTLTNFNYEECKKDGYIFKNEIYCKINGEFLKKPSDEVKFESIYKKWGLVELIINISRTLFTFPFLVFLFFAIKSKDRDEVYSDKDKKEKYIKNLSFLIICIIILIIISIICIIIRATSIIANNDIGLYPSNEQNSFESKIAINYIFDFIEIALFCIEICFVSRLKKVVYKKSIIVVMVQEHIVMRNNVVVNNNNRSQNVILNPVDNFNY